MAKRKETWIIPEDTSHLIEQSLEISVNSLASNSRRTYERILERYESVMALCKVEPYPLTEHSMRLFIQLQLTNQKTWSYVNITLESFVHWFRENNAQDLTKTIEFVRYKKGLRRVMSARFLPFAKKPVTKAMLEQWNALDDPYDNPVHADIIFCFMMMWLGFLRISEFMNLTWDDLKITDQGLEMVIAKSKTDQEAEGVRFLLPKRRDMFDAMSWFAIYEIWHVPEPGERVWCHSDIWIRTKVKLYTALIGMDPSKYSAHSFRKGGANAAFRARVQHCVIKVHGRWTSEAYQRYTDVQPDDAAREIILRI